MGTRAKATIIFGLLAFAGTTEASANSILSNSINIGFEVPAVSVAQNAQGNTLSHTETLGNQGASAGSFASFGRLTAQTTAYANDPGPYLGGSGIDRRGANGYANFEDTLTIFAGAPGSVATAVFAVRISEIGNAVIGNSSSAGGVASDSATIGVSGASSSGLRLTTLAYPVPIEFDANNHLIVGTEVDRRVNGSLISNAKSYAHVAGFNYDDTYLIDITFISGQSFTLTGRVECASSAATDSLSPVSTSSCSVRQRWLGLRSALDNTGQKIAAFTTSGSGFNYGSFTPGVPEPGNWALLLAGFGITGSVLRRRRAMAIGVPSRSRG